jgi:hypothetical protein
MRTPKPIILLLAIGSSIAPSGFIWPAPEPDPEEYQKDSAAGLPPEYAKIIGS